MKFITNFTKFWAIRSLPIRGAWIEIVWRRLWRLWCRRSLPIRGAWIEIPFSSQSSLNAFASLPIRGAWIEIFCLFAPFHGVAGRSPYGERGLKWLRLRWPCNHGKRRSPYGERGLKSARYAGWNDQRMSLPIRGAWIEIKNSSCPPTDREMSLPIRGAWIEM